MASRSRTTSWLPRRGDQPVFRARGMGGYVGEWGGVNYEMESPFHILFEAF
jgi:hypothetical protein